jgi:SAM-dependent methyltransferase
MTDPSVVTEQQLGRQVDWLRDSWTWLLQTKVIGTDPSERRLKALDVGCGPGLVMQELGRTLDVQGLDRDEGMVEACRTKGLSVIRGEAEEIPFDDDSFDVVYCSFLLLWTNDPSQVVREMRRVSRRWVICLAEPDYGGRIDHPEELGPLKEVLIDGLARSGADPMMGRKLRAVFERAGMAAEVGAHPGVWSMDQLSSERVEEWRNLVHISGLGPDDADLKRLELAWERALMDGILFQYSPIFYALAKK